MFSFVLLGLFFSQSAVQAVDLRASCSPTENKACLVLDHDDTNFMTLYRIIDGNIVGDTLDVKNCGLYRSGTSTTRGGGSACKPYEFNLDGQAIEVITRDGNRITFSKKSEKPIISSELIASFLTVDGTNPYSFDIELGQGELGSGNSRFSTTVGNTAINSSTNKKRRPFRLSTLQREYSYTRSGRRQSVSRTDTFNFLGLSGSNDYELTATSNNYIQVKIKFKNLPDLNSATASTSSASGIFELEIDGREFFIQPSSQTVIDQLRSVLSNSSSSTHKVGAFLNLSNVDYNNSWSFHMDPDTIEVFSLGDPGYDLSCDAGPDLIERHLFQVGTAEFLFDSFWCPLSTMLVREL